METSIVSPVGCVEEVVHRTRVIVTEAIVVKVGEIGEIEDSVERHLEGWGDTNCEMLSLGEWALSSRPSRGFIFGWTGRCASYCGWPLKA